MADSSIPRVRPDALIPAINSSTCLVATRPLVRNDPLANRYFRWRVASLIFKARTLNLSSSSLLSSSLSFLFFLSPFFFVPRIAE